MPLVVFAPNFPFMFHYLRCMCLCLCACARARSRANAYVYNCINIYDALRCKVVYFMLLIYNGCFISLINLFDLFLHTMAATNMRTQHVFNSHACRSLCCMNRFFRLWNKRFSDKVPSGHIKSPTLLLHFCSFNICDFVVPPTHCPQRPKKFEIKNHLNISSNDKNVSVSTEKGGFKKLVHICHSILRCPHRMAATPQEKKEEDRHQRWNNSLRSTRNTGDKRVKHKNRKHKTSQVKSLECSKQNSEKFTSNCNYCYCRRYVQFIFGIFFCFSLALHYNIGSMYISFVACTNEKWNETEIKKNGG